jgi:hypothetical protein
VTFQEGHGLVQERLAGLITAPVNAGSFQSQDKPETASGIAKPFNVIVPASGQKAPGAAETRLRVNDLVVGGLVVAGMAGQSL